MYGVQQPGKIIAGPTRRQGESGYVLVTMALASVALMGALGLAVDVGRMYVAKNETQAFCDSAALAAALALDGTTAGIAKAQSAVANSTNTWNFNTARINGATVTFATGLLGPWSSNPGPATGYTHARVTTTVQVRLYVLPLVVSQGTTDIHSSATAGQIPITSFPHGLAPYTAVSTNPVGPTFGLVVGSSYDIQWPQFNGSRGGCGPQSPDRCFNSPPCSGETAVSELAVVTSWGANNSGYWGSSSNSSIQREILDLVQVQPVAVGQNIFPVLTSGNKAAEAGYLDQRASQDINGTDNTVSGYLGNPHNGRRLIAAPIVDPIDTTHTTVLGYGQFLLLSNGSPSNYYTRNTNGNDPYCALYAGPYNVGSTGIGAGGSTGATRVKLVE